MKEIRIGGRVVGRGQAPYLVAEAGINHNGNFERAVQMIHAAKKAGADAVKFQTYRAAEVFGDPKQTYTYKSQGKTVTESMFEMFKRCEFTPDQWRNLKKECDRAGVHFLSTPSSRPDLDLLLELKMDAIKVSSDDFINIPLVKDYATTGIPLILSTGMSDLGEIYYTLDAAKVLDGYPALLLVCTSQYPTPPADANVLRIRTLSETFPMLPIGFSDHTQGSVAATVAVAFGACFFEKHFTLDQNFPGPDHWFSETSEQLTRYFSDVRTAHTSLGSPLVRPTATERSYRAELRRVVVAASEIQEGQTFDKANISLQKVTDGKGLSPSLYEMILGRKAHRRFQKGQAIEI